MSTGYWEGGTSGVYRYKVPAKRTIIARGMHIPVHDTVLRLRRYRGDEHYTLVLTDGSKDIPLATNDLNEAKAAAIAIWRTA